MENILKKYPKSASSCLIPILQEVQEAQGILSLSTIQEVSNYLDIPVSKIYCIATFYNQFRFRPQGKNHIKICRGTACHLEGSFSILSEIEKILGISDGETTRDGLFSLEIVSCLGACSLSPVIEINGDFKSHLTVEKVRSIIEEYRNSNS